MEDAWPWTLILENGKLKINSLPLSRSHFFFKEATLKPHPRTSANPPNKTYPQRLADKRKPSYLESPPLLSAMNAPGRACCARCARIVSD